MVEDANARFARLTYLCEASKAGKHPTMNDTERVAVALVMGQTSWLRRKGCSHESAQAFIGPGYAAVLDRVRDVVYQS